MRNNVINNSAVLAKQIQECKALREKAQLAKMASCDALAYVGALTYWKPIIVRDHIEAKSFNVARARRQQLINLGFIKKGK